MHGAMLLRKEVHVRSKERVRDGAHANFLREAFYGATARGHSVPRLN